MSTVRTIIEDAVFVDLATDKTESQAGDATDNCRTYFWLFFSIERRFSYKSMQLMYVEHLNSDQRNK
jgi:hypothetical protein